MVSPTGWPTARKAMASSREPSPASSTQRMWLSPITLAKRTRCAGKAKRGDGLPCPNGPALSIRSMKSSLTPAGVMAPSISRAVAARAAFERSRSMRSKRARTSSSLSRATVRPAAMAWPPPLTSSPSAVSALTAPPISTPAIERSEPVPWPPFSQAMTQLGRRKRSTSREATRPTTPLCHSSEPTTTMGRSGSWSTRRSASAVAASSMPVSIDLRSRFSLSSSAAILAASASSSIERRRAPSAASPMRPPALMRGPSTKPSV